MLARIANTNGYRWVQNVFIMATIYATLTTWLLVLYFPARENRIGFSKGKSKSDKQGYEEN